MYSGNPIQQAESVVDENGKPRNNLAQSIEQLVNRVFTDVYLTVGVPVAGLGEVNDYAVNLSTNTAYEKTAAGWVSQGVIDNDGNAFLLISSKR